MYALLNLNIEYKHVLNYASKMKDTNPTVGVDEEGKESKPSMLQMALLNSGGSGGISLAHIAGTCLTKEADRLRKLVFRATKGLALTYFKEIVTPIVTYSGKEEYKSVFIILY